MDETMRFLRAISASATWPVLERLLSGERTIVGLAEELGRTRDGVSYHLAKLERVGAVTHWRTNRRNVYFVNAGLAAWLAEITSVLHGFQGDDVGPSLPFEEREVA